MILNPLSWRRYQAGPPAIGHAHFGKRAAGALSRRQFFEKTAGVTGAVVASGLLARELQASPPGPGTPRPIPLTVAPGAPFHIVLPGSGNEPSAITDFHGAVGLANVGGTGTGTDLRTGAKAPLLFDVDVRFIKGHFIGTDGRHHRGTFGFF